MPEPADIDLAELRRRLADGRTVVLNVLPEEAYRQAHIPGTLNLPVDQVEKGAASVAPDRNRPIVVYCGGFN
ncbi:MAG: rhodanese-like domain-containing protein [Candidatus Xenobia bacterium]